MSNENAEQTSATAAPTVDAAQTQTTPPPSAPPAEPTQQEKAAKMEAIVGKMAGKDPKPEPPPKESQKTEEPPKADPPKLKPKSVNKLLERLKESDAEVARLQAQLNEIAAKEKDGKATELDEYKKSETIKELNKIADADAQEFQTKAAEALGDKYEAFTESNEYYAPWLNRYAPAFSQALGAMENSAVLLNEFYNAFNDGSIDFNAFLQFPAPRQIAVLHKAAELIRNPQPPAPPQAPPAVQPPKVPVPTDSAVSALPTDKMARMNQIVANMAKSL